MKGVLAVAEAFHEHLARRSDGKGRPRSRIAHSLGDEHTTSLNPLDLALFQLFGLTTR